MLIDPRYLFATDARASREDQLALIEAARSVGFPHSGLYGGADRTPYWRLKIVRSADPASVSPSVLRWFETEAAPGQTFQRWAYQCRLDDTLQWRWLDDDAGRRIDAILAPLAACFQVITRVNINLQVPGQLLPAHRDLVAGLEYDGLESPLHWKPGPHRVRYVGEPWLEHVRPLANRDHRATGYYAVKIPLSERAGDPGLPFIIHNREKYYYTTDDRVFFLNEYEMYHGADPVDFWRGVVFVAGVLDPAGMQTVERRVLEARRV